MITIGMKHVKSSAVVGCIKKYCMKINIHIFFNSVWTKIGMFFCCKWWNCF